MRNLGRSPWLLGIGAGAAAVIAAVIGWGRARPVEVPRPLLWDHAPVVICVEDHASAVLVYEGVLLWREHGYPLLVGTTGCNVRVEVNPALDDRDSVDDDRFVHGRTSLSHEGPVVYDGLIEVLPGSRLEVYVHELGHALGFQHPNAAPSGHVLHPSRPGLRDWRGLEP